MKGLDQLRDLLAPAPPVDPAEGLLELAKTFQREPSTVAKQRTPGAERLALDDLQVDHDYQRPPDWERIAEFRATLQAGGALPPLKVNRRDDGSLWITDGQHRAAAAALEGHTHIDARVTHKPSWEEPQETNLVAKVAPEDEGELVTRLRGAGAVHRGKRLVLDLGRHGEVIYAAHGEPVGKAERGQLRVEGANASGLLERLDLVDLAGSTGRVDVSAGADA